MKLYLISQTQNHNYDTYDGAVVRAMNEDQARHMDPGGSNGDPMIWEKPYSSWGSPWCSGPEHVRVELIGNATKGSVSGVVCASFNAG